MFQLTYNMKKLFPFLLCLLTTTLITENKAKDHFENLEAGKFSLYKAGVFTGWSMKSEDGNTYQKVFLNIEASKIEGVGLDAVPVAIKYLNHPHKHIRYIAAESLKSITKKDPIWYAF